jgi:2-polyprenyl-3-methyl-5-hydroxy-6-metoxy-1,4-benzoquinol methylase
MQLQSKNSFGVPRESGQSQSSSSSKPSDTIEPYQYDPIVWLYYGAYSVVRGSYICVKLLINSHALLRGLFSGIWLGLLRHETLLKINRFYYSRTKKYKDSSYNKSGLWAWESAIIARYFRNCKRLLLIGAGGGREVLALRRLGYEVNGFECNSELVRVANTLLNDEGLSASIRFAPPDMCPNSNASRPIYDGLIVGWGAYMLIRGHDKRVAVLRKMRAQVNAGAPLLVSFFSRSPKTKQFLVSMAVGNSLRWVLGRENIELGDALEPEYVHYFSQEEITGELRDAGFMLEYYTEVPYGHAVGIAS